ncbi:hypothetical protein ACQ4LE_000337 [Meloidogyne hapla]
MRMMNELLDTTQNVIQGVEEVKEINNHTSGIVSVLEENDKRKKRLLKLQRENFFLLFCSFAGAYAVGAPLGVASCFGAVSFPFVGIGLIGGLFVGGLIANYFF